MTARYMLRNMTACYMPDLIRTSHVLITGNVPRVLCVCCNNWLVYTHGRVGTRSVGAVYSHYSTRVYYLAILLLRSEATAAEAEVTAIAPISRHFGSSQKREDGVNLFSLLFRARACGGEGGVPSSLFFSFAKTATFHYPLLSFGDC